MATRPGAFIAGDVLGAADMNLLPSGKVGYAVITASQTGISTEADVTSLTVTWTAVSARLYRTSFFVFADANGTASSQRPSVKVTDGSNTKKLELFTEHNAAATAQSNVPLTGAILETGLSGSTTRKLRALSGGGGDTIDINAAADSPCYIIVEDVGPAA